MSVAAQQEIESGVRCLPINFGSMRQQDREALLRNPGSRLLDIVDPVKVRIINPGDMNMVAFTLKNDTFIE